MISISPSLPMVDAKRQLNFKWNTFMILCLRYPGAYPKVFHLLWDEARKGLMVG